MSFLVELGQAAVVLHPVRDLDGDTVTGQAGSISTALNDPSGASSGLSVTVAEVGATGWYTLTVTPTSAGLWRLQATGEAALGRAVPDGASPAFVDYVVDVVSAGVSTTGNLLTTTARCRTRLGIDTAFDTILDDIVAEVSGRIQDELGRAVLEASYTDYLDGSGTDWLLLRQGPLVSVASVNLVTYEDDGGGGRQETLTEVEEWQRLDQGLRAEGHLGAGSVRMAHGQRFTPGRRNYRVAYTAGFSTVPESLAHVATLDAVAEFNLREVHGLRSKSTGDASVDPVGLAAADAARTRALRPYMEWVV